LVELIVALGHPDGLRPIQALMEEGLLYPDLADDVSRLKDFDHWLGIAGGQGLPVFAHPSVTARTLGEDLGLPELRSPHAPSSPVHEADGLEWFLRLAVLWQRVAAGPLRRTPTGG